MPNQIKITCLVNNEVAFGSSLLGEHGLSFLVETPRSKILFDAGQSTGVLKHNLDRLKVSLDDFTAVALSHGHNDHTSGLPLLFERPEKIPLFASPHIFESKFSTRGGTLHPNGLPVTRETLEEHFHLHLSTDQARLDDGVYLTGAIPRLTSYETNDTHLARQGANGLEPDPVEDDQSLVLRTDQGLVVLMGCCHTGLINTLTHVRAHFGGPIHTVLGGSHLKPAGLPRLEQTLSALKTEYPSLACLGLNHCTGFEALSFLRFGLGDHVRPFLAGESLIFQEAG